jgi:hypothetical protein
VERGDEREIRIAVRADVRIEPIGVKKWVTSIDLDSFRYCQLRDDSGEFEMKWVCKIKPPKFGNFDLLILLIDFIHLVFIP